MAKAKLMVYIEFGDFKVEDLVEKILRDSHGLIVVKFTYQDQAKHLVKIKGEKNILLDLQRAFEAKGHVTKMIDY